MKKELPPALGSGENTMPDAELRGEQALTTYSGKLVINPIHISSQPSSVLKYIAAQGGTISDYDLFVLIGNRRKTLSWLQWAGTRRSQKIRHEVWNGQRYHILTRFGYRKIWQSMKKAEAQA
jgi:hypothetical protein